MSVYITLNRSSSSSPSKINKLLNDSELYFDFPTDESNEEWLNDINENPKSPQSHLKPEHRDLTMDELKIMFSSWTNTKECLIDIGFGRVDKNTLNSLAYFIENNHNLFESIYGVSDIIKRGEVNPKFCPNLLSLEGSREIKMLSDDNKITVYKDGCIAMVKGMNGKGVSVVFGNVDEIEYMTQSIYADPSIKNPLILDENGNNVLICPTMAMGKNGLEVALGIESRLNDLYFEESFSSFMIKMYKDIAFTMLDGNFVFSNEDEKQECVSLTRHRAYEEIGYSFLRYKKDNPLCDFSKPVKELEDRLSNSGNYIEYKLAIDALNDSKTYASMNDRESPTESLGMD